MPRRGPDFLVVLIAAGILALGLYAALLPVPPLVVAPQGAVFEWYDSGNPAELHFTVQAEGGRLIGAFVASNATLPWIHPSASHGTPRGPAAGVCWGRFDVVLPPDAYAVTFYGGPATSRIVEPIEVMLTQAPPAASQYAGVANGTACTA